MARPGKRVRDSREAVAGPPRPLGEAVAAVKEQAKVKFDESVDVAIRLGVDVRHSDQMVRGTVTLPAGTGKELRVAVFARDDKAEEAKAAGADLVGAEDLMETVQKGEINFERCIATPDMMKSLGKIARVLGPRGLMPNPKVGTVTADVADAVKKAKAGEIQFRTERTGVVHARIGRASFDASALEKNLRAVIDAVSRAKPSGTKGTYFRKIAISSTMGPCVAVDVASATG